MPLFRPPHSFDELERLPDEAAEPQEKDLETQASRRASHRVLVAGLLLMIIEACLTVTLVAETISASSHIQS